MAEEKFDPSVFVKAPHYFLVHFNERFTVVNGGHESGPAYPIMCDGLMVNVYGFDSKEEADDFDWFELRKYMIGSRDRDVLFDSYPEKLPREIGEYLNKKQGTYSRNHNAMYGQIEDLPTCERMFENTKTKELLCGKPVNEYGDGSCGGCVLNHYDQEDEFSDGFKCPLQQYWIQRAEAARTKVA